MGDNTLPDHVTGMQQLARRFPRIDIELAGIWRTLGRRLRRRGCHVPLSGLLQGRDFGGRQARQPRVRGRLGERYQGLLHKSGDGTMDTNVPRYNTLLVVNELIKADKDFDLLLLPNRHHGFGQCAVHGAAAVGLLRAVFDGRGASEGICVEAAG
jgi:dipeptidyl-peptidase-4